LADREDIAYSEGCFFAAVNESTGVETFCGDEGFGTEFVAVGVAENDSSQGSTAGGGLECAVLGDRDIPSRIVDNVFYDTTDVAIAFGIVEITETGRGFSVVRV
jgi:hypothetical protein